MLKPLLPSFFEQNIEVPDDDAVVKTEMQLIQQFLEVPLPVQPTDVGLVAVVLEIGQKGPYFVDEMLEGVISKLQMQDV